MIRTFLISITGVLVACSLLLLFTARDDRGAWALTHPRLMATTAAREQVYIVLVSGKLKQGQAAKFQECFAPLVSKGVCATD